MADKNSSNSHIVVVGAGILGSSIAFHLTLRGAQVTVVEAADPGQGTTRVSFAWINAAGKDPFHYHDLNRRSLDMWDRFVRRLGGGVDLTWGGELSWVATEDGAEALAERVEILQSWGYPTRLLDAAEAAKLEPDLRFEEVKVAAYNDIEGHVDTQQVVRACMNAVGERGAEICVRAPVTGFQLIHSAGATEVDAVQLGGDTIPCDMVVLAGGPDMPELAEMAEIDVPVYHTFGATILTEPVAPIFQSVAVLHPSRDRGPRVNFRQFRDGTVMVQGSSASNNETGDRGQTDEEVEQIVADAARYVPALEGVGIRKVLRGRRPIPKDGHPIIGFSESVSNLYLATTHSGVTLAPLIGEMAAIEILDGTAVDLLAPYRPARFVQKEEG